MGVISEVTIVLKVERLLQKDNLKEIIEKIERIFDETEVRPQVKVIFK